MWLAHDRGEADDDQRPDERVRQTLLDLDADEGRPGIRFREQVDVQRTRTALGNRPDHHAEDEHSQRGREPAEQLHSAIDDAAPSQPVVRVLQGAQIRSAHRPSVPNRRPARRTMNCASRFTRIGTSRPATSFVTTS